MNRSLVIKQQSNLDRKSGHQAEKYSGPESGHQAGTILDQKYGNQAEKYSRQESDHQAEKFPGLHA